MPYKNHKDKQENQKLYERAASLMRFRYMGVEPVEIDNPNSKVFCDICGKESRRTIPKNQLHEHDCPHYGKVLLRYPIEPYRSTR